MTRLVNMALASGWKRRRPGVRQSHEPWSVAFRRSGADGKLIRIVARAEHNTLTHCVNQFLPELADVSPADAPSESRLPVGQVVLTGE